MSVYETLYSLLQEFIFSDVMTNAEEIACTLLSTIGTIFVVVLPFVIVWKVIKTILE